METVCKQANCVACVHECWSNHLKFPHATGLPETVWAAAVPANYDRVVTTLVDDVYGDHEYMVSLKIFESPDA